MRETLVLALLSLIVALVSLAVVIWTVADAALTGMLRSTILTLDGLLMISVGLLISLMFGFCFLWGARELRLWERLPRRRQAAAPAGNPSPKETESPSEPQKPSAQR